MDKKGQSQLIAGGGVTIVLIVIILVGGLFYYSNTKSPYISKMSLENNFVEQGTSFKIFYKIKNTQKTPLEPLIKVKFNEDCFRISPKERILDAIDENQEKAYFLEIVSENTYNSNIDCSGEQTITFDLFDKDSENKLDTKSVLFEIVNG